MITVDIKPAKRRFSNRKQWKFQITGGNGEPVDPRDTYANVGDILDIFSKLRETEVLVRIHYENTVEEFSYAPYPHHDSLGDTTVIGPGCFASSDGTVLNWLGVNYIPQAVPE